MRASYLTKRSQPNKLIATTTMRSIVDRLRLLRTSRADTVQQRLSQAGWRSRDAMVRYLFFKVTLPILFGAARC